MAKKLDITTLKPKIILEPVVRDDKRYIRCDVLIVCEGEKTEPNYFKSFSMMKNSSSLVFDVQTSGGKINTIQVVDKAIELRDKAIANNKSYDSVWAVFDRDSFNASDFDNAIAKAQHNDIKCAWSNEAFELWYVYHFDDRCTAMSRNEYKGIITQRVKAAGFRCGTKEYKYQKNDPNMRFILSSCKCDEKLAIKRAERQKNSFQDFRFNTHNPCTMVYELVKLLIGLDDEFNRQITRKLEEK